MFTRLDVLSTNIAVIGASHFGTWLEVETRNGPGEVVLDSKLMMVLRDCGDRKDSRGSTFVCVKGM